MTLKTVFGLIISSTFALPELNDAPHNADPDLVISTADLSMIRAELPSGDPQWVQHDVVHFHLQNGMCARVSHGATIELDIPDDIPPGIARAFLLASILTLALLQRGLVVFHANAININGQAVLCAGASGVGKSTTAAVFEKLGYPCHADDLAVINPQGAVLPGIPRIKLLPETSNILKMHNDRTRQNGLIAGKSHFRIKPATTPLPLAAVYLLQQSDEITTGFECKKLEGAAKLNGLLHCRFRRRFASTHDIRASQMERISRLAKTVGVFRVRRGQDAFTADAIADHIIRHMTHT